MRATTAILVAAACITVAAAEEAFKQHGVVPDVIDEAPASLIQATYSNDLKVETGNELTPTQVQNQPSISWPTEKDALYTLVMTDPDAPSRANPIRREFLHCLIGNIPGNDIEKGTVLFEYIGAGPPKDTGLHRYVLLVYKQPGHIEFKQETVTKYSTQGRPKFSIRKFASDHSLGKPIAGNFFQAQYDDYVPTLQKQFSG